MAGHEEPGVQEPGVTRTRLTGMRNLAFTAAGVLLPLSLTGCGSGGDHHVVSDPAPTAAPTVGSYPAFEPTDYTFELSVSCFCAGAGVPIEVTVADAVVVGAVYGMDDAGRGGARSGDPADPSFWLTIDDVIDKANDTEADRVEVDWPEGQDYPTSVFVDAEKNAADDEVGYTIADVVVS